MFAVGLTGGIGSGKTTVCNLFRRDFHIDVICADACAREVIDNPRIVQTIINKFGKAFRLKEENKINRAKLRHLITEYAVARKWLNALTHPEIRSLIARKLQISKSDYMLVDIPLLTKERLSHYPYLKKIITVTSPVSLRVRRITMRDKVKNDAALAMIKAQVSDDARLSFSDYEIENTRDIEHLQRQVADLHQVLLDQAAVLSE